MRPYILEARDGNEWQFVAEYESYEEAVKEIDGWTYVEGRVRRGNELITRNRYPVSQDVRTQTQVAAVIIQRDIKEIMAALELAEWRKKHIGDGSPDPSREAGA